MCWTEEVKRHRSGEREFGQIRSDSERGLSTDYLCPEKESVICIVSSLLSRISITGRDVELIIGKNKMVIHHFQETTVVYIEVNLIGTDTLFT